MKSGLVSIIMPVYNGERFLRQAVQSVLDQDYPNWELVAADDGSTDQTSQVIHSFHDSRIRYSYKENGGQASALNHALDLAEGEFVTTLDADDWLSPGNLGARVRCLEKQPEHDAVYSDGFYTYEDGRPLARFSDYCASNVTGDLFGLLLTSNMFGTGAAVLIRSDVIQRRSLRYDEAIFYCQDWDFYLRLAETASFAYLNEPVVYYRLHSANMTMQAPSERKRNALVFTRQKVMRSTRFEQASNEEKSRFFDNFLRQNLRGESNQQMAVIEQNSFQSLPPYLKGRLVRLVALDYVLMGVGGPTCRSWLRLALDMDSSDQKTRVVSQLYSFSPDLARQVVKFYRKTSGSTQNKSPFQLVTG